MTYLGSDGKGVGFHATATIKRSDYNMTGMRWPALSATMCASSSRRCSSRPASAEHKTMALKNDQRRYGAVAMTLHWLIALAILANVALAFYFNDMLDHHDGARFWLVQTHKSIACRCWC